MNSPAIKLSTERHAQIAAIKKALNHQTLSETIAYFVNNEIVKGTIPAGIQGVTVNHSDTGCTVAFDEQPPISLSPDRAATLAERLREFTDPSKRAELVADIGGNYSIERKGNGVKLTIPMSRTGVTKSFSRDLARDLADLICK